MNITKSNVIWKYFERNNDSFLAKCHHCSNFFSYRSTLSNLRKHLRQKHALVYRAMIAAIEEINSGTDLAFLTKSLNSEGIGLTGDEIFQPLSDSDSELFGDLSDDDATYQPEDEARSSSDDTDEVNLNNSKVQKFYIHKNNEDRLGTLIAYVSDSENGQDRKSENEQDKESENPFSKVVYLEDKFTNDKPHRIPDNQQFKKIHLKRIQSMNGESLNEPKTEVKKQNYQNDSFVQPKIDETVNENDEIAKFVAYITCLLRQLPKDVSSKLQMTIIQNIMVEKVKVEQSMTNVNP